MHRGHPDQRRRITLAAVVLSLTVLGAACSQGSPSTRAPAASEILAFAVTEPVAGSTVTTSSIQIAGTGPAGATVVRDISFAPDDSTVIGSDGTWVIVAGLDPGINELTVRLGDDKSTAIRFQVTREEAAASPTASARTSTPQPPGSPVVVSPDCAVAFHRAAIIAQDPTQDSVTDLDPAVRACLTVDEWVAASELNPGAISEGVDPVEFLRNRCASVGLREEEICQGLGG